MQSDTYGYGIYLSDGDTGTPVDIQATGSGNIIMTGESLTPLNNGRGVYFWNSRAITNTGDIDITGTGGSAGKSIGKGFAYFRQNSALTTASGTITVIGNAAGSTAQGIGCFTTSGGSKITISSPVNPVSMTGTVTVAAGTAGIYIDEMASSGGTVLNLTGDGGEVAGYGIYLYDDISHTGSGNISLTATGGTTKDFISLAASTVGGAGYSGNITLTVDSVSIAGGFNTSGSLTIRPSTPSTSIGIGDGAAGTLNISNSEMVLATTNISNGTIIGYSNGSHTINVDGSGTITFAGNVTLRGNTVTIDDAISMATKDLTINIGQTAAGTLTIDGTITANSLAASGAASNDTFDINVNTTTQLPTTTINGGAETNELQGPDLTNTWTLTGANAGTLGDITFSNIQTLTGGTAADTFTFSDGASVTGSINGGTGTNTLDYSAYTSAITVNFAAGTATGTGGFSNIYNVTGGLSNNDTIVGPNLASTWQITATDGATVTNSGSTITFTNIENWTGGTAADRFVMADAFFVRGKVDGGVGASNTLDYSNVTINVTINLNDNSATQIFSGAPGGIANIQGTSGTGTFLGGSGDNVFIITSFPAHVEGDGGTNTLQGPNQEQTWNITSHNGGTIVPAAGGGNITFTDIQNLTGGSAKDTFVFYGTNSVDGLVNGGGGGNNTVNYTNYSLPAWVNMVDHTASAMGSWLNIQIWILNSGGYIFTIEEALDKRTANYLNISQYWRETLDDYQYGPYFIFNDLRFRKMFWRIERQIKFSDYIYGKERTEESQKIKELLEEEEELSIIKNIIRKYGKGNRNE